MTRKVFLGHTRVIKRTDMSQDVPSELQLVVFLSLSVSSSEEASVPVAAVIHHCSQMFTEGHPVCNFRIYHPIQR